VNIKSIEWDDRYSVGVQALDEQHRELVKMTNKLYLGSLLEGKEPKDFFVRALHNIAGYLKFHLATEEQFLDTMRYPDRAEHKKQHDNFIKNVFSQVQDFENGLTPALGPVAGYLRDWVLTHIAFTDKKYALYLASPGTERGGLRPHCGPHFHFPEKYLKGEFLPPPELFWG
jgi:hemerythrin